MPAAHDPDSRHGKGRTIPRHPSPLKEANAVSQQEACVSACAHPAAGRRGRSAAGTTACAGSNICSGRRKCQGTCRVQWRRHCRQMRRPCLASPSPEQPRKEKESIHGATVGRERAGTARPCRFFAGRATRRSRRPDTPSAFHPAQRPARERAVAPGRTHPPAPRPVAAVAGSHPAPGIHRRAPAGSSSHPGPPGCRAGHERGRRPAPQRARPGRNGHRTHANRPGSADRHRLGTRCPCAGGGRRSCRLDAEPVCTPLHPQHTGRCGGQPPATGPDRGPSRNTTWTRGRPCTAAAGALAPPAAGHRSQVPARRESADHRCVQAQPAKQSKPDHAG